MSTRPAPVDVPKVRAVIHRADAEPLVPLVNGLACFDLAHAQARLVACALEYAEGDRTWAAQLLGIAPSTLWRLIRQGKIEGEVVRSEPHRGRPRLVRKEA